MSHRDRLPQLSDSRFLTDGGIETTLIFDRGIDLPLFAAFSLLTNEDGTASLRSYYEPYLRLAAEHRTGFVLESPTWRASPRWASELGYSETELDSLNRRSIELMVGLRAEWEDRISPIVISGCVGPQGDGYSPEELLSADEAQAYHRTQIETFADTSADQVTAVTMTYVEEALGIARAAADAGMPVAISFTVETDGKLPSGQVLSDAIEQVDAETGGGPAYYMVNCAHPTHFDDQLDPAATWAARIQGLRANASTMSHAELDEAEELDRGDPADLGRRYGELTRALPNLNVLGGCCGTDHEHVAAIAAAANR